jgi:hypothetical protein
VITEPHTNDSNLRTGIDSPGLDDSEGFDADHIQQMVQFLRLWTHGVNAFVIVLNGQDDKFDEQTQQLVKFVNTFLNDRDFWNHVCLVFTKCYSNRDIGREQKETTYRELVMQLIRQCNPDISTPPRLPVFFVDSKKYDTDPTTKHEFSKFHQFASGLKPLSTQEVVARDTKYLKVEIETRKNILTTTRIEGDTRIQIFEDQERKKNFGCDGKTISYGPWIATSSREEKQTRSTKIETKIECTESRTEAIMTEKRPFGFSVFGLVKIGGGKPHFECIGNRTIRHMEKLARNVTIGYDGEVSLGNWTVESQWDQRQ